MFDGFHRQRIEVNGVTINSVSKGQGDAVLLLHGYPQNHFEWARLAPLMAQKYTVVCTDLRGYGDSSKPPGIADQSNYSFRTMAADQVGVMKALGHHRFHVVGHDRGGRVAHRMALDWPDEVQSLTVLDLVPTHALYNQTNRKIAATYWQWYFLPLPAPFPERLIGADPDYYFENCLVSVGGTGLSAFNAEMLEQYRRCWRDPAMIHASCCDYRAGASVDLGHDEADLHVKVACPTLAVWGADGLMCRLMDIEAAWRERCAHLTVDTVPGGHWFPEHSPEELSAALQKFFAGLVVN
jgi:haloacetate dehalogenase